MKNMNESKEVEENTEYKKKASPEKLIEIAKNFEKIALEENRTHYEIIRAFNSIYSILSYSILNKYSIENEIKACMFSVAVPSRKVMENNFLKINVFVFGDMFINSIFQTRDYINSAHNLVPKFNLSADFIQKLTD
ncbi:MAG TPA: hypothetical protein PK560_08375, partial [bacterium]|nr:hypothetical protein [bacterium]